MEYLNGRPLKTLRSSAVHGTNITFGFISQGPKNVRFCFILQGQINLGFEFLLQKYVNSVLKCQSLFCILHRERRDLTN